MALLVAGTAQAASIDDFVDFSLRSNTGSLVLPGRLYVPPEAVDDPRTPRPLILFLHGAGESGSNNLSQINQNIDNLLAEAKRRSAFLYAPQTPLAWEDLAITSAVNTMVRRALNDYSADASRLYVTGLSLGGGGTWNMLNFYPERFAAAVPIAGVGPSRSDVDNLVGQPIWAFHARDDSIVTKDISRSVINSILAAADKPTLTFPPNSDPTDFQFSDDMLNLHYTEWPFGGHGIWPRVYDTDEMYAWLFGQQRRITSVVPKGIYAVSDTDGDAPFDGLGDGAADLNDQPRRGIGETDSQTTNQLVRIVVKFELPETIMFRNVVERARLRFFLEDVDGTPSGPLSIFQSINDNDLTMVQSDYEDASYRDTFLNLVGPASEEGQYYELDVTDLVRADYAADGEHPLSAFRLQVNEAVFVEDNQGNRYRFTMPGAGINYPELVVTFVPEPSALSLAVLGLLVLAANCQRRRGDEIRSVVQSLFVGKNTSDSRAFSILTERSLQDLANHVGVCDFGIGQSLPAAVMHVADLLMVESQLV